MLRGMDAICSRCGADLPVEARFCPRCGASAEVPVSAERRVVTVVFADLADSTALSSELDPERFREIQNAFYRTASESVAALRGRVEKFIGDAVMAVFGLSGAHEDDALRAVRSALEIRDRAARLGDDLGVAGRIAVRIGVDSGPAVVGAGPADQLLVSGAAVNLAARLQQAAGPGEILAGETTRQLTASSVRFADGRSIQAKGFTEPIVASPVEELTSRSSRRVIPLVGRRHELTMLRETLARVRETSRLHLVTVLGEPGIGKSRLVDEFVGLAGDDVRVRRGRASRFEEDAPFAPVVEMIRREIGATDATSSEEVRVMLEKRVAAICRPEIAEVTTKRLGLVLGIETDEHEDRRYRTAIVRSALLTLLEGLASEGPVVLAFEDLELARPELLELIEGLATRGRRTPVMLLCVGRDEMLSMRPSWGGGIADSMTLRIEPLPSNEAIELARASGTSLDEDTAERVARHAGGNPFFIVETTGMLLHDKAESASTSPPLPATVQAVVATRIDHLAPAARDLVRKASVFARSTFHTTELAVVAEATDDVLQSLEDEELFVRDAERPAVWRFNHQVVRDVAYESLPKRERRRLHLALADRLASDARYPAALAFHLERAARASLDLDPEDRSIAERAASALLDAGDIARRRMELESAIDLYERGLALGPPEHHWGDREARMLCGIGEASYWLGEFARARDALDRALRMRPDDDRTLSVAHRFLGDIALNIDNDLSLAAAHFDKALPASRRLPDSDVHFAVARTLLMAGWVQYMSNDFDGARKVFEEALSIARSNPEGDAWAEARALTFVSNVMAVLEPLSEYRPLLEEALAIGRRMNDPFSTAVAEQHFANALGASGDLDESLPHARAAFATFAELGAKWETASALGDLAELERLSGRVLDAEEHQREAVKILRDLGDRQLIGWISAELALSLRAQGRRREALAAIEEVSSIVDANTDASTLRAIALLAMDEGDRAGAASAVERLLQFVHAGNRPNAVARSTWFAARLLGADAVGGEDVVRRARDRLEAIGWKTWLEEDLRLPAP
jgi:class 3 adenylate cyclase/tetratricopeptide (TPR) repeat protein